MTLRPLRIFPTFALNALEIPSRAAFLTKFVLRVRADFLLCRASDRHRQLRLIEGLEPAVVQVFDA
jgi:hypothetical protein